MTKAELIEGFRARLLARRDVLLAEQGAARAGTRVDGSHRPANRGERAAVTSQAYLADALNRRLEEVQEALRLLDEVDGGPAEAVRAGALVVVREVEGEEGLRRYLVLPGGQGDRLEGPEGGEVLVISPVSPVARALAGRGPGEEARLPRAGSPWIVEVEDVA